MSKAVSELTATERLTTIVVGVDDSAAGRRALRWAAARASETGADVVAVHVLTYSHEFAVDLSLKGLTNWRRDVERDLAGRWTDAARALGAKVRTAVVEHESTVDGLLAVADREDADLIVVGARGRGGMAGRILGATTYSITHRARMPVVVIPDDGKSRQD